MNICCCLKYEKQWKKIQNLRKKKKHKYSKACQVIRMHNWGHMYKIYYVSEYLVFSSFVRFWIKPNWCLRYRIIRYYFHIKTLKY